MPVFNRSGARSRLFLAIALASGAAIGVSAPAYAQKKKQEQPAERKANYSKAFAAAYSGLKAPIEAKDFVAIKAALPALLAAAQTPDDKLLGGQLAYQAGFNLKDTALEKQGLDLMLGSGLAVAQQLAGIHHALARIAYNAKDFDTARTHALQAAAGGQTDAELLIAESYFAQGQANAGLERLDKVIAAKVAAGQPVPEDWLKRGLAFSYKANLEAQAIKYAGMYAQYYPSTVSWGDAINIQRNLRNYDPQELLDLMRLARRVNALRNERDYVDYISAVDPRRLPGEAEQVIAAGIAAGLLKPNDVFVAEARSTAAARLRADQADLPNLARDARLPSAAVATLMAAGDAFLSYGRPAEAEEFYTKALTKPGVDTARVLTRLAIAQLDLGKTAEAQANLARVEGARQAIAGLWSLHAAQAAKDARAPAAP